MKLITILLLTYILVGCQTASTALDSAQSIRDKIAQKETDIAVQRLCSSNFDIIRAKYGNTDKEWAAILTICGSGKNSTSRTVE